jgi:hypothetical protein
MSKGSGRYLTQVNTEERCTAGRVTKVKNLGESVIDYPVIDPAEGRSRRQLVCSPALASPKGGPDDQLQLRYLVSLLVRSGLPRGAGHAAD